MLTDAKIKAAMKAVATEVTLNDKGEGRGAGSLLIVIRRLVDGVSATWFARVKRDGKRSKKSLGRYPDITLSMARQLMRTEVSPQLRAGKALRVTTVNVEKPTVERMFQAYVDSMKAKGRASAAEVERMLLTAKGSAAERLGRDTLAADVTDVDVVAYVATFYKRGFPGAAHKARSYVGSAFTWALRVARDPKAIERRDWGVKANPAADIPRDTEATTTRDRNLSADELAELWAATEEGSPGFSVEVAACIRLLICCGQRIQETLRIDGADIDLGGALWKMPKHKTKGKKRPHTIPLPPQAVATLRPLVELYGDGPLFPARAGSKAALILHNSVRQAIDRWMAGDDVTVEAFQPRDIRRTWKSRSHDAGIDRETRDIIQQHAKHDTGSKNYDRADYLPQMTAAMAKWSTWLSSNVERLKKSIGPEALAA
ncbi:MAG TPA: site-specific integrase [Pyrinomonadaceae bacterium]|nr:site-specific integrase [Pyrinomonadaceae bacterium]